ncbi:unnamed protein product, partial [Ilex paraguariensis]
SADCTRAKAASLMPIDALTWLGVIRDSVVDERQLAEYFLAILSLSDEYKKWAKLSTFENNRLFADYMVESSGSSELDKRRRKQSPKDHTQDSIVHNVRRTLFEVISSFHGNLEDEKELERLIETQFTALQQAFHVPSASDEDGHNTVSFKLLNLYRTGRLGHYTLDFLPRNASGLVSM